MKVIGYYTLDTPYEQEFQEIKKFLESFSIDYHYYGVDNKGKWELNCGLKSRILRQALEDFNDNILYLDVDARILRDPPFASIEDDLPGICVWNPRYRPKGETLSGTIYLPNNQISRDLLDKWIDEQNKNPNEWDQRVLEKIYKNYPHKLLHHDWINIIGTGGDKTYLLKTDNPIILHTQASRKYKTKV